MKNNSLVQDYIQRANDRIGALEFLYNKKSWANVVREAQEVVELTLKAYVRHLNFEVPRIHDVSSLLMENKNELTGAVAKNLNKICSISKSLRRDRELAFYGTEDLTPSSFYTEEDATLAKEQAEFVFKIVKESL